MKKKFLILLVICLLIPFRVKAIDSIMVTGSNITGPGETKVGEEVDLSFSINFSGVGDTGDHAFYIAYIEYDIECNQQVLLPTTFNHDAWNTQISGDFGRYTVYAIYDGNDAFSTQCQDEVFCNNINTTIRFYVKQTTDVVTMVKINNVRVWYVDLLSLDEENLEESMKNNIRQYNVAQNTYKSILINQTEQTEIKEPTSQIGNTQPETPKTDTIKENLETKVAPKISSTPTSNPSTNTNQPLEKSNNNFLSLLQVKNYQLSFDKNVNDYEIEILKDVNSLNVTATPEDEKATKNIIGFDNLEANNHQVKIEVTAENGEKRTYTISAKIKDTTKENLTTTNKKNKNKKKSKKLKIKLEKKHYIIGGISLFILLIIFIIIKFKDRKIDKALKDL